MRRTQGIREIQSPPIAAIPDTSRIITGGVSRSSTAISMCRRAVGGNGDDGIFQGQNGAANAVPTGGTSNTIVQLLGTQATNATGASSPLTPFGFTLRQSEHALCGCRG